MSKEKVFVRVSDVLVETFEFDPGQILPPAHLIDALGLASIDLAVRLEEKDSLDLLQDELKHLGIIQDVVGLDYRKLGS